MNLSVEGKKKEQELHLSSLPLDSSEVNKFGQLVPSDFLPFYPSRSCSEANTSSDEEYFRLSQPEACTWPAYGLPFCKDLEMANLILPTASLASDSAPTVKEINDLPMELQSLVFADIVSSHLVLSAGYNTDTLAQSLGSVRCVCKSFRREVDARINVLVEDARTAMRKFVFDGECNPRSASFLSSVLCIDVVTLLLPQSNFTTPITWTQFLCLRKESDHLRETIRVANASANTEFRRLAQIRERKLLEKEKSASRNQASVLSSLLPLVQELGTEFAEEFAYSCLDIATNCLEARKRSPSSSVVHNFPFVSKILNVDEASDSQRVVTEHMSTFDYAMD